MAFPYFRSLFRRISSIMDVAFLQFKSNVNMFMWPPKFIDESFSFHAYEKVVSDPIKK